MATILRDYLQSDCKFSIDDIGDSIIALVPTKSESSDEVYSFARLCVEIAEQIPYDHPAQTQLIRLLQYLSRSPKFLSKTSSQV